MMTSESGQSSDGYGGLIGILSLIGLVVGILYMWLFQRPIGEAFFIIPLAIVGAIVIFALFILVIEYFQRR